MKKTVRLISVITVLAAILTCCFLLSGCTNDTLDKDYSFSFDVVNTSVWGIPGIPILFDNEQSGLTLTKDGTATITIMLNSGASSLGSLIDLSAVSNLDLASMANTYAAPILPWFDIKDLKGTLPYLKDSLGGELILDFDDPDTQKLVESIQTTGRINEDFVIPKVFGLRYSGKYTIKTLVSEVTGKEYKAVYLDKFSDGGEPYLIITLTENEEGALCAELAVEFLKLRMAFTERTAK